MDYFSKLDTLLKKQTVSEHDSIVPDVYGYAKCMAELESVVAVVSDLAKGTSRIYNGDFAKVLGVTDYCEDNSIWETKILSLMPEREREEKFIAELRFFHYLRRQVSRRHYYLMSKLRFANGKGRLVDVLHRMYYIYDKRSDSVRYAICLYGPLSVNFAGKSVVVNSLTGICEELSSATDSGILSSREKQILALIDSGLKSKEIAERLSISLHTVSRHRQEILAKLQVKNSHEACRIARSMALI